MEGQTIPGNDGSSFTPTEESPIFLTPAAIEAVRNAIAAEGEEGDALRVSVQGGGCSGYQYALDFDKEVRMGDLELEFDGVKVLVDSISAGYLKGTVVDYLSGLNGTGFKFSNPNAKRTCGCGSSFS
jgi:iron-sulfur cluster assembly accessory protein